MPEPSLDVRIVAPLGGVGYCPPMCGGRRDFRRELERYRCWDRECQEVFESRGEAVVDAILQNREELIGLCELIETHRVRSYLEVGIWTGGLVTALHEIFRFDLVAACDHGYARRFGLPIRVPSEALFFEGESASGEYEAWRRALGPIDFVLIDANHSYRAVRRDFEVNRSFPQRFLALHDITGARRQTAGVGRLWREIREGNKLEIVRPHRELGLNHSTMGIGIWSATERLEG
jgi:hypothetical protein